MKTIYTPKAPNPIGPYSQAIVINGFVYSSGVLAINLETGNIDESSIEGQTNLIFTYIDEILKASNSSIEKVVKTTIFLKDLNDFPKVNQIYQDFFRSHKPARSTVEVSRLPKDGKIEIELIATI